MWRIWLLACAFVLSGSITAEAGWFAKKPEIKPLNIMSDMETFHCGPTIFDLLSTEGLIERVEKTIPDPYYDNCADGEEGMDWLEYYNYRREVEKN